MTSPAPTTVIVSSTLILATWVLPINLPLPTGAETAGRSGASCDMDRQGNPELTGHEKKFISGELAGDEAEQALMALFARAAASPDGIFVSYEVPDEE